MEAGFFAPGSVDIWWPALLSSVLAAVTLGYVGVFVLLERAVFVGAALSQASMLGFAVFLLLSSDEAPSAPPPPPAVEAEAPKAATEALDDLLEAPLETPTAPPTVPAASAPEAEDDHGQHWGLLSALLASLGLATLLAMAGTPKRITSESLIGVGYVLASAGVVLIRDFAPGDAAHIDQVIFGTAATVPKIHVLYLTLSALVVLGVHVVFRRPLLICAFDPEHARVLGYDPVRWNVVLFLTFAVAISVATQAIGGLPVFGLLLLPAAASLLVTRRMAPALIVAPLLGAVAAVAGYVISWEGDLPTGATQVACAGLLLGACAVAGRFRP